MPAKDLRLPKLPIRERSVLHDLIPATLVPITTAEQIVPITKRLLEHFKRLPMWMKPSKSIAGEDDLEKFWEPLVVQVQILREAIQEYEKQKK